MAAAPFLKSRTTHWNPKPPHTKARPLPFFDFRQRTILNIISNMVFSKLKCVDLFCGCGGLATGLKMAGIEVLAGVDWEPKYLGSFSHNFPESQSLDCDLVSLTPQELMSELALEPEELFLVAGGPPCQGFSKNVPRCDRWAQDPRNLLVRAFLSFCEALRPQWVLLENVAEMKNGFEQSYSEEILARLEKAGYHVAHRVINAADFGVPQRRRRAFFVANRLGIDFEFPTPTHTASTLPPTLFPLSSHVSVWEAISDLPSLEHGEGQKTTPYCGPASNEFQSKMRGDNIVVSNHVARALQPTQFERLSALQPGQGLKDLPLHLQTKGGYSGAYGRLTKEMIAPTITRWVFHPGSGRWGHPVDIRTLSIREIARLQSFPDAYEFIGSFTDQAGQLGNAVPPLLALQLGVQMLRQTASRRESNSMNRFKSSLCESGGTAKVM